MARGNARSPAQNAYQGALGKTQTRTVHVTNARSDLVPMTVHTTVNALNDPELVERLYAGSLNTLRLDGEADVDLAVPIVYHDPANEVMVLVLGAAHRHREIEERIALLEQMRADDAAIPAYAKDFAVVFGGNGLRAYLEQKAQSALGTRAADAKDVDKKKRELQNREAELERMRQELERDKAELQRKQADHETSVAEQRRAQMELQRDRTELERTRAEARQRLIAAAVEATAGESTSIDTPPTGGSDDVRTKPLALPDNETVTEEIEAVLASGRPVSELEPGDEIEIGSPSHGKNGARVAAAGFDADEQTGYDQAPSPPGVAVEIDDEPTGTTEIPTGSDPLTTTTTALRVERDKWLDGAVKSPTSMFGMHDGKARLALVTSDPITRSARGNFDVRVLLHRLSTYPVVVMLIGPPSALRAATPTHLVMLTLDIGDGTDRAVLDTLAKKFELTVDFIQSGISIRRVRLVSPLADNVAYILRAADDHLRGIAAKGESEPSYTRARDLVLGAGYDLLSVEHAEGSQFRDDKLAQLDTAQAVRRALAITRRFARPSREDYLVCARGYPLQRWRSQRKKVLARAVKWGIWMGPELAQIAISEGLARSRRELVLTLDQAFEALRHDEAAFDIDADAAEDNAKAIAEEARALGVELRGRKTNGAIKSEDVSVVSGSIDQTPISGAPIKASTDELIALLDDKSKRASAAAELCDRGDPRAAPAVIKAAAKMSRTDAVRVLGKSVKFGPAAAPPLLEGLGSSKAFLRHGCALALALLRLEDGTHAVIELLVTEPTEIWREVARAIGQIGPGALMPLAAQVGRVGDAITPAVQERVAWAMAHIGVRGGKAALDQMAAGHSVMAPIAKQALELHANAARDEVQVRPGPQASKDVTVNRAFSRRFFEAIEADRPDIAQAALHDLDAGGPEVLDDADIMLEEDEAELDESDLIQT